MSQKSENLKINEDLMSGVQMMLATVKVSLDSSVGIVTCYGLDGSVI